MNDPFMAMKIGPIKKKFKKPIQNNRFFEVGPTLREKPPCQYKWVMHTNTEIKAFKMADTKRTTGRFLEENLHVLRNLHGAIYRPDKTGQQIVPCKPVLKCKFYGIFCSVTGKTVNT